MITDGAIMVSPHADCSVAPSAVSVGGQRLVEFGVQAPPLHAVSRRSARSVVDVPVAYGRARQCDPCVEHVSSRLTVNRVKHLATVLRSYIQPSR
jgi:hypothetical protein